MKSLFESQICVDCGEPCHFGSGRFVNRYSVYADDIEGCAVVFVLLKLMQ